MPRTKPWMVSDEFWERVEPLVPEAPSHARGARPRISDRKAFEAMVYYVLRTGIQWNALPREREMGASSTVHERFQEWERAGFFEELWRAAGLVEYEEMEGIEWEWQAVDGVMTKKAPLGRAATGPNPTDRAKKGVKRSLLTEGSGIPLAVVVDGANRPDAKLLVATLDGIVVARRASSEDKTSEHHHHYHHLCLEAGYDSEAVREEVELRGYEAHIRPRDKNQREDENHHLGAKARRWVVERTHSWLNRSLRLLVRWEKKTENYQAFVHLACAQLIFSKTTVSG